MAEEQTVAPAGGDAAPLTVSDAVALLNAEDEKKNKPRAPDGKFARLTDPAPDPHGHAVTDAEDAEQEPPADDEAEPTDDDAVETPAEGDEPEAEPDDEPEPEEPVPGSKMTRMEDGSLKPIAELKKAYGEL